MITHTIIKHKLRIKIPNVQQHQSQKPPHITYAPTVQQQNPNLLSVEGGIPWLGKQQYNEYIQKLRLKAGDYCFFKTSEYPIPDKNVFKVQQINELWYTAKGNNYRDRKPLPYFLKNVYGEMAWGNDDDLIKFCPNAEREFE